MQFKKNPLGSFALTFGIFWVIHWTSRTTGDCINVSLLNENVSHTPSRWSHLCHTLLPLYWSCSANWIGFYFRNTRRSRMPKWFIILLHFFFFRHTILWMQQLVLCYSWGGREVQISLTSAALASSPVNTRRQKRGVRSRREHAERRRKTCTVPQPRGGTQSWLIFRRSLKNSYFPPFNQKKHKA